MTLSTSLVATSQKTAIFRKLAVWLRITPMLLRAAVEARRRASARRGRRGSCAQRLRPDDSVSGEALPRGQSRRRRAGRAGASAARSSKLRAFCDCAIAIAACKDCSAAAVLPGSRFSRISPRIRCISASYQRCSVRSNSASALSRRRSSTSISPAPASASPGKTEQPEMLSGESTQ